MDTHVRTPQEIFIMPQHLVVPPFQRPYVWDQEDQWAPLWHDIRSVVEDRLISGSASAHHFLGAIVLQSLGQVPGEVQGLNVIDGQQRLTTIQILMDAVAGILSAAEQDDLAGQISVLTHNQAIYVPNAPNRLKLRHTNRDKEAFEEVMEAEPPVDYPSLKHSGSRIARAHSYFTETVAEWLGNPSEPEFAFRAASLVDVLTRGLQLVTINLGFQENSQEIFETLNARGTPLTAADLIRNFVFQKLEAEGANTREAYARDWPFDTKFWEATVGSGRHAVSRSSLFFNQWLVSRLGEEVSPKATFTRFKQYIERISGEKMGDLLPVIKQQADLYEAWTRAAEEKDRHLSRVEMSVYRMRAGDIEVLKPILIWLHAPGRDVPPSVIDEVVGIVESWIVRRQLLRLTGSDAGRVVADLIRLYSATPPEDLASRIRSHLANLNVSSTYWPGDDEVRNSLRAEPAFRIFKKARLRMVLEAIENQYRKDTNQPQVPRRGYPIEHILPQKWETHWPVDDVEAGLERASYVHRLGNLTLLTSSLNSKVSNGPWEKKWAALQQHDTLLLNSRLLASTPGTDWDEDAIDRRTEEMIDSILVEWPAPAGHKVELLDRQSKAVEWVQLKDLVDAGLLQPGTTLYTRPAKWAGIEATVTANGLISLDGEVFDSPSGAAGYLEKRASNGWHFWKLADGRRLADLRTLFQGETRSGVDWQDLLHIILEAVPEDRWTSVEALGEALGVATRSVADHLAACSKCSGWSHIWDAVGDSSRFLGGDDLAGLLLQEDE